MGVWAGRRSPRPFFLGGEAAGTKGEQRKRLRREDCRAARHIRERAEKSSDPPSVRVHREARFTTR